MSKNKYVLEIDNYLENMLDKKVDIDMLFLILGLLLMVISCIFILFCYSKLSDWWWWHKPEKKNKKNKKKRTKY